MLQLSYQYMGVGKIFSRGGPLEDFSTSNHKIACRRGGLVPPCLSPSEAHGPI